MKVPKCLILFSMLLTLSASVANAQSRDYNGCISIPYKGSPTAQFYKALISKVPSGEKLEVRQPADMKELEVYGLESGAPYRVEISACRDVAEGEICDEPDVFHAWAKASK